MKELSIITIDGMDGIGKTTQINCLMVFLKSEGFKVKVLSVDETLESVDHNIDKAADFLEKNPDGLVLSDGSFSKMMILDKISGMRTLDILEKYKDVIHKYEVLSQKYGIANLLLVMDSIEVCSNRIQKRERLQGRVSEGIVDLQKERVIINELKRLDDFIAFRNLKFHVIDIDSVDTIREVLEIIKDFIKEKYKKLWG